MKKYVIFCDNERTKDEYSIIEDAAEAIKKNQNRNPKSIYSIVIVTPESANSTHNIDPSN
jgi:hypothetical protein